MADSKLRDLSTDFAVKVISIYKLKGGTQNPTLISFVFTMIFTHPTNWNLTLLQFENLFLCYFFAPSTFVAIRTL